MKTFVQQGDTVPFTAPYNVPAGGGALVGSLFVVAVAAVLTGARGQGVRRGVVDMAKATGVAWTEGVKLYWDNTAKNVTATVGSNTLIGVASQAQASGDAIGRVTLGVVA